MGNGGPIRRTVRCTNATAENSLWLWNEKIAPQQSINAFFLVGHAFSKDTPTGLKIAWVCDISTILVVHY